jgi:hypothetical protein
MKVREATIQDKSNWDSFVNENNGSFLYYFDWKRINEINESSRIHRILLMIETDMNQLIGICHLIQINHIFYSSLVIFGATGILFKNGLSYEERSSATAVLLLCISKKFHSKCSSLTLREENNLINQKNEKYNRILLEQGFKVKSSGIPGLPCSHILPLTSPFEENIWKGLWSTNIRQKLRKAEKMGIKVIQDKEFKYIDIFLDMVAANYRRHDSPPPNRERMISELNTFKDKTRLFVALVDDRPLVTVLCHYTPSTSTLWEIGSYDKDTNNVSKYCYKAIIEDACVSGYQYMHLGGSYTEGLAQFKDWFKAVRIPIIEYEKRYSAFRKLMERFFNAGELTFFVADRVRHDPTYLWDKRKIIWDRIVQR